MKRNHFKNINRYDHIRNCVSNKLNLIFFFFFFIAAQFSYLDTYSIVFIKLLKNIAIPCFISLLKLGRLTKITRKHEVDILSSWCNKEKVMLSVKSLLNNLSRAFVFVPKTSKCNTLVENVVKICIWEFTIRSINQNHRAGRNVTV